MKPAYELLRELARFTFFGIIIAAASPLILAIAITTTYNTRHEPTNLRNRYQQ